MRREVRETHQQIVRDLPSLFLWRLIRTGWTPFHHRNCAGPLPASRTAMMREYDYSAGEATRVSQSLSAASSCGAVNPPMKHNAPACIRRQTRYVNNPCTTTRASCQRNMVGHCRNGKIDGRVDILGFTDVCE
jgi:hypothetical protein